MHPPTHFMMSWFIGHRMPVRRDRCLIAWAGVAPDLDGLTILAGFDAYGRWHHVLTHGFVAALVVTTLLTVAASDRPKVACLALTAFHLHLACDLLGSGLAWPIQYWWPFNTTFYASPTDGNWTVGRMGHWSGLPRLGVAPGRHVRPFVCGMCPPRASRP